jgi:hypothetical protein
MPVMSSSIRCESYWISSPELIAYINNVDHILGHKFRIMGVDGLENDKLLKEKSGLSPIDVTIFLRACLDAFYLLDNTH